MHYATHCFYHTIKKYNKYSLKLFTETKENNKCLHNYRKFKNKRIIFQIYFFFLKVIGMNGFFFFFFKSITIHKTLHKLHLRN